MLALQCVVANPMLKNGGGLQFPLGLAKSDAPDSPCRTLDRYAGRTCNFEKIVIRIERRYKFTSLRHIVFLDGRTRSTPCCLKVQKDSSAVVKRPCKCSHYANVNGRLGYRGRYGFPCGPALFAGASERESSREAIHLLLVWPRHRKKQRAEYLFLGME